MIAVITHRLIAVIIHRLLAHQQHVRCFSGNNCCQQARYCKGLQISH